MSIDFIYWVAENALRDLREGQNFSEGVAETLGAIPYVDRIREGLGDDDRCLMLQLIDHRDWWMRKLAVIISRHIADEAIVAKLRALYDTEHHFHTRLSVVYALCGLGQATDDDRRAYLEWMAEPDNRQALIKAIGLFYGKGSDDHGVIVRNICSRLQDSKFAGSTFIYVYSLGLFDTNDAREELQSYVTHDDQVVALAAQKALSGE